MYRFRSFILLAVISVLLSASVELRAQDAPIKWGEIPMEDLQMKSLPSDTNASAYILCDYGKQHFNDDLDLVYERHLRVKILTTKGFDEWGTHSVDVYTHKKIETLDDIEGVTYYLDDKGGIAKKELKSRDIFEEEVSDRVTRYKFTMPALQPGCIVEIRYKTIAHEFWFARGWEFQYNEPVRWSEFIFTTPVRIDFGVVTSGYEQWEIKEDNDLTQFFNGSAKMYLGDNIVDCVQYRWGVKDLPALRDEPFTTCLDDYRNCVKVQLRGFGFVGMMKYKKVLNDWETVAKELLERKDFGRKIEKSDDIVELASEITAGLSTETQKLQAIYTWVTRTIVWDGGYRITSDTDIDDLLEKKKGTTADISFLILSLLKSVGINSDPVIASTRNNGRIITIYPLIDQFNYLLVRATADKQTLFIDATDPMRPMELLPYKLLNTQALVVRSGAPELVTIASPKRYLRSSVTNVKLQPDGSFTGRVCESYSDYSALGMRKDLKDKAKKEIDIVKETLDANKYGLEIDSVNIENLDSLRSVLKIRSNISASSYAQVSGDMIYINPKIIYRSDDNPLKTEVRKFPVDYGYRYTLADTINIQLPDSFEVKERFPDRSAFAAAGNIKFFRTTVIDSNSVRIVSKMEINELAVKPSYYAQLRNFYSQTMAFDAEQLVLQKKKPIVQAVVIEQPMPSVKEKEAADKKTKASEKGKNGKKRS